MEFLEVFFLMTSLQSVQGFLIRTVGKTATISSVFASHTGPENGLDGDLSTLALTRLGLNIGWWTVDLVTEVTSPVVKIYFRLDYKFRRNGVRISLSNQPGISIFCNEIVGQPNGEDIRGVYQTKCEGRGRYLNISTVTSNDGLGAVLDFAEVEVYEKPTCSGPIAWKKHQHLVLDDTESIVVPAANRNACAKKCFGDRMCPAFSFSPQHGECKIATGVVRATAAPNWDTYGHFIIN